MRRARRPAGRRSRLTARGRQDAAGAYPAYVIRYRTGPGVGPLETRFPAPAGPDSLMARGDAAFRAHLLPALDPALAAAAADAAGVRAGPLAPALAEEAAGRQRWEEAARGRPKGWAMRRRQADRA